MYGSFCFLLPSPSPSPHSSLLHTFIYQSLFLFSLSLSPSHISLNCRYWTVTNIDYNNLRTPRRVFIMIFCVWFAALIVSLAPQFGWKDPDYMKRIEEQNCMVSQDVAYQVSQAVCLVAHTIVFNPSCFACHRYLPHAARSMCRYWWFYFCIGKSI